MNGEWGGISQLPIPNSLFPTPYSLLPTPYSLLPTPYSPLPTPYLYVTIDEEVIIFMALPGEF